MKRTTQLVTIGLAMTLISGAMTGCSGPAKSAKPATVAPSGIAGTVVETMDAAGYTYICIEKGGEKTWAAVPTSKVTVGQQIKLLAGAPMSNFQSKALNRTFDVIIFSGGVDQGEKPAAIEATKVAADQPPVEPVTAGKVLETLNANNYTYVLLEKDGRSTWSAIPASDVNVGEEIELQPGTEMGNFKSKTLNRTFDSITFSGGIQSRKSNGVAPAAATAPAAAAGAAAQAALPPGHPKMDAAVKAAPEAAAAKIPAAATLSGKVVETMDAGGYTYLCLEHDGKKTWAAVPTMKASVGQEMTIGSGQPMSNFTSKTLNRTFDQIIFSSGPMAK